MIRKKRIISINRGNGLPEVDSGTVFSRGGPIFLAFRYLMFYLAMHGDRYDISGTPHY
jgi:hypothetical protein